MISVCCCTGHDCSPEHAKPCRKENEEKQDGQQNPDNNGCKRNNHASCIRKLLHLSCCRENKVQSVQGYNPVDELCSIAKAGNE